MSPVAEVFSEMSDNVKPCHAPLQFTTESVLTFYITPRLWYPSTLSEQPRALPQSLYSHKDLHMTRPHNLDGVSHSINVPEDLDADGKDDYTPGIKLRDLGQEDVHQFPGLRRQHCW